jgi:hypothetical protein
VITAKDQELLQMMKKTKKNVQSVMEMEITNVMIVVVEAR